MSDHNDLTETCGVQFVHWFWTGPWLVTCRQLAGHDGEHNETPPALVKEEA